MPASTLDPVNAALRSALGKGEDSPLDEQLAGSSKKVLLSDIDFEPAGSYQSTVLDKLKSKYIVLKSSETPQPSKPEDDMGADETLKLPSYELYPFEAVQLGWSKCDWSVGAGMINMGNTCYLNSTLQALFHVPALVNWLISDKEHTAECQDSGGLCIICAMRKTLQDSQQRNTNAIRPLLIYNKLRLVCRNLIPGRQEDAHEFLRYLVEAMEKSYLSRFKNHSEFDSKVKETTPLNQILGGYLRSAVRCLKCGHVSTTFQHFQDLLLDIRKAQTLDEALEGYFAREKLDDDSYHCQSCQKKVPATKQFSLERAPMVLCIQLKRFSVSNNKITKHIHFRQRLDLTRYARHRPSVPLIYRLVALVTHMGPTVNCGHYTAVAQAPSGNFYQFDDSMLCKNVLTGKVLNNLDFLDILKSKSSNIVLEYIPVDLLIGICDYIQIRNSLEVRVISHQAVFNTNAYIMLYELESSPFTQKSNNTTNNKVKSPLSPETTTNNNNTSQKTSANGIGFTSDKVYGPELPPDKLKQKINGTDQTSLTNGNGSHSETSSSSDSEHESTSDTKSQQKENKPITSSPPSPKKSSISTNNNETKSKPPLTQKIQNRTLSPSVQNSTNVSTQLSAVNSETKKENNFQPHTTKLVPYETDDSSGSDDSNQSPHELEYRVSTKAAVGEWKVTSTEPTIQNKNRDKKDVTVNELFKMSHSGYSAPVSSWNGTRAQLDKEISNERREDRKRAFSDNSDQGKVKHQKINNNSYKSNPGYNPVQEFHNAKNWSQNSGTGHYKPFYSGNRHRRNFHHKNFHKNYRFRQ